MTLYLKESNFPEHDRKSVPNSPSALKWFEHKHTGQKVSMRSPISQDAGVADVKWLAS